MLSDPKGCRVQFYIEQVLITKIKALKSVTVVFRRQKRSDRRIENTIHMYDLLFYL